ncbi:MAG: hypothetical protein ABI947_24835 [Chloroflexota bacterium]
MLKLLEDQLQHSDTQTRLETLYALVMVLETEALDVLAQMSQTEQVPEVKEIIAWAVEQIDAARQQGYSTTLALQTAYPLDPSDKDSTQDLEKMHKLEEEMAQARLRAHNPDSSVAGALGKTALIGALSLAATGGNLLWLHHSSPSAGNRGELAGLKMVQWAMAQENKGRKRPLLPPRPADTGIKIWLKKLTASEAPTRLSAVRQLADFNNPAALGPLGWVFAKDTEPEIRQAAQRVGLQIYIAALYWQNLPQ